MVFGLNSVLARFSSLTVLPSPQMTVNALKLGGEVLSPPFQPEPIRRERSPLQQYATDSLDVSERRIRNRNFVEEPNEGISVHRPEIISLTNFKPIFTGDAKLKILSEHGCLLETRYQASYLRRDALEEILINVRDASQEDVQKYYSELAGKSNEELEKIRKLIKFYKDFIDSTEILQNFFNVKNIDQSQYETNKFLSLREFFEQVMRYRGRQFDSFTSTKILFQLLFDFKAIAENYSVNLLNLKDEDRKRDKNPVEIDDSYTISDGFTFTVKQLRSEQTVYNAMQSDFFNSFLGSLPKDADDRIKILLTMLSKEYRVSKAMGTDKVKNKLQKYFNAENSGNPFDNILGVVGGTIFEQPLGPSSLASYIQLDAKNKVRQAEGGLERDRDFFILPFEDKYIDSDDASKTFVPGKSYFVDSIFDLKNEKRGAETVTTFNVDPLINYADKFSGKFRRVRGITRDLFYLKKQTDLDPEKMYDNFLLSLKASIEGTNNGDINQVIFTALFKLANRDNRLKSMLFQYLCLCGLQTNTDNDLKTIWSELASELFDASNIPEVKKIIQRRKINTQLAKGTLDTNLLEGPQTVSPYIAILAQKIDRRIRQLILPQKTKKTGIEGTIASIQQGNLGPIPTVADLNLDKELNKKRTVWSVCERRATRKVLRNAYSQDSNNNIIKEFINLMNKFSANAMNDAYKAYLLGDASGRTRYNYFSTTTQMLVVFEMLCSFVEKYTSASFANRRGELIAKCNKRFNRKVVQMVDEIIGESTQSNIIDEISKGEYYALETNTKGGRFFTRTRIEDSGEKKKGKSSTVEVTTLLPGEKNIDILDGRFTIRALPLRNNFLEFRSILSTPASEQIWSKSQYRRRRDLRSNRVKLETEDSILENVLYIFEIIVGRMKKAREMAQRLYGSENKVAEFEKLGGKIKEMKGVRDPSQIMVSSFLYDNLKGRINTVSHTNPKLTTKEDILVVSPNTVHSNTKEALYSYLSEDLFQEKQQASDKVKILSVGIPSGFIRALIDRVKLGDINRETFKSDKQLDVVTVNVYKRDIRFDDVIFKPKKFIFDLSLFQRENEILSLNLNSQNSFSKYIQNDSIADFSRQDNNVHLYGLDTNRDKNVTDITKDNTYDFLTGIERRSIVINHFQSFLLDVYIQLTTGLKINEGTFIIDSTVLDEKMEQKFEELVLVYIRDILQKQVPKNQTIQQVLSNDNVEEDVKDILRLVNLGSVIFSPTYEKEKIMRPKMFDRVFHVPIHIDEFEIDREATRKTKSGKKAMKQAWLEHLVNSQKKGEETKHYLKRKEKGDVVFEDYFITIENEF